MPYAYFGVIVSREPLKMVEQTPPLFKTPKGKDVVMPIIEVGKGSLGVLGMKMVSSICRVIRAARTGVKLR